MRKLLIPATALLAVLAWSAQATATPFGTYTSTDGLVFTLSNDGPVANLYSETPTAVDDTFQFTLSLDYSGYTGSSDDWLKNASLKVSSGTDAVQQVSAPAMGATWAEQDGGLNNGGCDGSGSGFWCTQSASGGIVLDPSVLDPTASWVFWVDVAGGWVDAPSLKSQWFTAGGDKIQQISVDLDTPSGDLPPPGDEAPEPTTLLLLATGLFGAAGAGARRRRVSRS